MKKINKIILWLIERFMLFNIGGLIYFILEILWRGYSHWTMYILAGICFLIIGELNESFEYKDPLIFQMIYGSIIITVLEFIFGIVLNKILGLGIWDYSNMPFNLMGQICLPFTILWFFLSLVAIVVDDYIRYFIFGEEEPHYIFFNKK